MATRSTIAKVMKGGSIKQIYCHWDGYLAYNGNMLLEHYNTARKVNELIKLGSLSSLRPKVRPRKGTLHTFDSPQAEVVIAYGRDRGETGCEPNTYRSFNAIPKSSFEEFNYIFRRGKWYYRRGTGAEHLLTKVGDSVKF